LIDPKVTLRGLLEAEWDSEGVGFTPRFTADWYDGKEQMPQVVVSHVITTPRSTGFSDELSKAVRRFEAVYAVDVWSKGDQERRWTMIQEVDRIQKARCRSLEGGLEFGEVSGWRDLDEADVHPRLYRSRIRLRILYYR